MKKLLVTTLATLAMAFQAFAGGIKAAEVPEKAKEYAKELKEMKAEDQANKIAEVLSKSGKYAIKSADVKSMLDFLNEVGVTDSNKLVSYVMKVFEVDVTGDNSALNLKSAASQLTKALIESAKFTGQARTDAKEVLSPLIGASGVLFEHASTDGAALNKLARQIYSMNVAIRTNADPNVTEKIDLEQASKKAFKNFLLGTDSKLSEKEIDAQYRKWKEDCKA